jgi:3'-phosphoadenosine 5'-phosphosulfate sulfotransferase (PAPS reductase)/FAD synthetase
MSDPFLIQGPAVISFSGGRTSGYMLWRILQAHGGTLPEDVRVIFSNTGKEMPETLDFVEECSKRWNVPITWVEYGRGKVAYETASRNGEPYAALIEKRSYLPNPVARFCTQELKIFPMQKFCELEDPDILIGFRADEPRRVAKLSGKRYAPLARAGITVQYVEQFWASNDFNLKLPNRTHSNCDLCFLKGADQIMSLIREQPKRAAWWMAQELKIDATFRKDRPSYAQMHKMATNHGELFAFDDEPLQDCMCTD